MNPGDRFVEALQKLGYPKASKLEGEDFEWLFETTDAKSFLDWFCGNVTQQNVVSEDKLQAFNELKDSGKAVLDEKALGEVMKTFKPASSKEKAKEEVAIQNLEDELQTLKNQKSLHIQRRNKLQMMGSANVHSYLKYKDREDEEAKSLKKTMNNLQVTSNKLNHELHTVIEGIKKLISFYAPQEGGSTTSPIFLFQVLLDKYLSCEEESTNALTLFTKEHFFEGLSKCIEGSENDFQLVQLDGNSGDDPALEDKCKEMMRLQLAYISAKHKLIQTKAKRASLVTGLQWVENNARVLQGMDSHKDKLKDRIASLKEESSKIENRIAAINSDTLPVLVRESAQLLNMPVVKGDYDVQIAHHKLYLSRQDLVCDHLMEQKASFELLQMGYELEFRKQRNVNQQLEMMIQDLKQNSEKLETRLLMMSDDALLSADKPRTNMDSKDTSSHGLFQLLDGDKTQKLFRTYSGLESVALNLSQEIHAVKNQLAVCEQEQSLLLSKLEANMKSLQDFMYTDGSELILQTPEVSTNFQHLHANLDKLNKILLEVLEDLRVKRKILESSKFDKLEKQLYIYFFQNEKLLKSVVESMESQAEVQSSS